MGDPLDVEDDRSLTHSAFADLAALADVSVAIYPGQFGLKVFVQNILGNSTPAPGSLGSFGGGPANGQVGIDERLFYFSVEGRL